MKLFTIGVENFLLHHLATRFSSYEFINIDYKLMVSVDFFKKIKEYTDIDVVLIGINGNEISDDLDFVTYYRILNNIIYLIDQIKINKKIIFLSSYTVYEPKKEGIYLENDKLKSNSYISEVYNTYENMIRISCKYNNIEFNILRVFNLYSPLQPKDNVIMSIIDQFFNKDYILIGDTKKERDYIYIKDFLNILEIILEKKIDYKLSIYNVGSGVSISIKNILDIIKQLTLIDKQIIFNSDKIRLDYDYQSVQANVGKLKRDFNYEFNYDIKLGLKELIEIYKMREVIE